MVCRNWKNLQPSQPAVFPEDSSSSKEGFDDLLAKSVSVTDQRDAEAAACRIHLRPPPAFLHRSYIVLHRNPFDVQREDLVEQLSSLKFSLLYPDRWKGADGIVCVRSGAEWIIKCRIDCLQNRRKMFRLLRWAIIKTILRTLPLL